MLATRSVARLSVRRRQKNQGEPHRWRLMSTSNWRTLESSRYGLTMSRPTDWLVTPASIAWDLIVDQQPDRFMQSADQFSPRDSSALFLAYGMDIPDGMTSDGFIEAYRAPNVKALGIECYPPPSRWQQVLIDGHSGGLVQACNYTEAIVVADRRIYIFTGFGLLSGSGYRRMFDAFLSTVRLSTRAGGERIGPAE